MLSKSAVPQYRRVKEFIVKNIEAGLWKAGDCVPSENVLAKDLDISRMTVNRALRELTQAGLLERVQGTGTFVAQKRPIASILELRNIADEIRERGETHSTKIEALRAEIGKEDVLSALGLAEKSKVYFSLLVHLADGRPVQVEERYVNPNAAPGYLKVNFSTMTPNEYLMRTIPATEVEHVIEAVMPDQKYARFLKIGTSTACLQLTRRTKSNKIIVSYARLLYPSDHRFATRFSYRPDGSSKTTAI